MSHTLTVLFAFTPAFLFGLVYPWRPTRAHYVWVGMSAWYAAGVLYVGAWSPWGSMHDLKIGVAYALIVWGLGTVLHWLAYFVLLGLVQLFVGLNVCVALLLGFFERRYLE